MKCGKALARISGYATVSQIDYQLHSHPDKIIERTPLELCPLRADPASHPPSQVQRRGASSQVP